jgi:hypothetical protein
LFSINTITISYEIVSFLNVRIIKIRIDGESEPEQGISYQRTVEVVASTTKTT